MNPKVLLAAACFLGASLYGAEQKIVLPESVPDPMERFNRAMWGLNQGIMTVLVKPTGKGYRTVVRKPVRIMINNFGRNITYPGRMINNLLQARWAGACDETYRFACNSVLGAGGLFDLATEWKIPKSEADFGQTFGQWGWNPNFYLMLPIFGPSNDRDVVGLAADTAANPLSYLTPYPFSLSDPLTYVSPYTYCSFGVMYNNLADSVDSYVRFSESQMDAYSEVQYAWTFARKNRRADFHVKGEQDPASLETLQSAFFRVKDPEFPNRGKTRSVLIPSTGKRLNFTFWLQKKNAPVVYIVPGLGSHRLSDAVLALAESLYQKGYSAVSVSSTFNHEFMLQASTASVPAYIPVDAHDLHVALTAIDGHLAMLFPGRFGPKALLGYSMGGFQTLFVAANEESQQEGLLKFDRYVAINAPVHLLYGISQLDEFYDAPLAWPESERTADIENIFLKVAELTRSDAPQTQTPPPFSAVESKFLIGLAFRLILRDAIFTSQLRYNQGILHHQIGGLKRAPIYQEILDYSYKDYLEKFLIPYYSTRARDLTSPEALEKVSNLRTYSTGLQACKKIRVITNRNDFLLPDEDLKWLQASFSSEHLTVFEQGGHLGNLGSAEMQHAIGVALDGLRPVKK
jgi:ABC-type transporter lipoprotein component MlaA